MRILTENSADNNLSFVKESDWTINDFDLLFVKTVGDETLLIESLQDELGLADCTPFIVLPVDLVANSLSVGEFTVSLLYQDVIQESLLVEVKGVLPEPEGGDDIYGSITILD